MVEPVAAEQQIDSSPCSVSSVMPTHNSPLQQFGIVVRATANRRLGQALFGADGDTTLQSILQLVTACCMKCESTYDKVFYMCSPLQ